MINISIVYVMYEEAQVNVRTCGGVTLKFSILFGLHIKVLL